MRNLKSEISRLCPETSTKLYVIGFWDKVRSFIQKKTWGMRPCAGANYNLTLYHSWLRPTNDGCQQIFPQLFKNKNGKNGTTNSVEPLILERLTMHGIIWIKTRDVQMSRCCMLVSRSGKETKSPLGKEPTLLIFYIKCAPLWFAFQYDIRVQLAADREKWFLLRSRTVTCLTTQLTGC
jgi:hypothetical protein